MAKVALGINRVVLMAIAISVAESMTNGQVALAEASITARVSESDSPMETLRQRPTMAVTDWTEHMAQQTADTVTITDIQLNATEVGVEIILVTESGLLSLPVVQQTGNALIADIPNAVLDIFGDDTFQQLDPVEGIGLIEALTVDGQTVQLTITGTDAPPVATLGADATHLVLRVAVGDPTAVPTEDGAIQLVVTGAQGGYVVPNATTVTRTDTPLRDVPRSIQVIPQEILEDQQVFRLNDAIRNVSGVVTGSNDPRGQRFNIRGFDSSSVLRDGFRLTNGGIGNSGFPELANIEQIEILKGPAAIQYGVLEPGGVINLVSEQPLSEPTYEASIEVGNRALVSPSFDLSGPLSDDGRVLYRFNALFRQEDYFRDFDTKVTRYFLAPTVSWAISDRTDITFSLESRIDERPSDFGLVAVGDEVADIPFDRALNDPDAVALSTYVRAGYQFEHRFNDDWRIRNAFSYSIYDTSTVVGFGPGFNEDTGAVINAPVRLVQPTEAIELQTNVVGEFSTGSIEHTLLAGIDLSRYRDDNSEARGDQSLVNVLNIFDPDYDSLVLPDFDNAPVLLSSEGNTDSLGVYLQDQVTLLDNLKLLAGVRYTTVSIDSTSVSVFNPDGTETDFSDDAFVPNVGLVYQPIEPLSLYASYSRSFVPNGGNTVSGDILDPERGRQFEVGARAELLDGRLVTNLALFDIVKSNVSTGDPNNPLFAVAIGEQRSRGVELDIIGEVLPGWDIVANYAYTDTEITEDNDGLEGNDLFGVPDHNFNLWTSYGIQEGPLNGLGFGVGFNFIGDRFGDNANSFTLDSYFLTNAAISYQRDNWEFGLNFRNLFDIDYIESSENRRNSEINPGEGFTVIGSIGVEF